MLVVINIIWNPHDFPGELTYIVVAGAAVFSPPAHVLCIVRLICRKSAGLTRYVQRIKKHI